MGLYCSQIRQKMKKHDRKAFKPYRGPLDIDFLVQETTAGTVEKVLEEFNGSTLDDVGPVTGGNQEMKVLKEMNDLQEFENQNWSRSSDPAGSV